MRPAINGLLAEDGPFDGVTCRAVNFSSRAKAFSGRYAATISAAVGGRTAIASFMACIMSGHPSRRLWGGGAAYAVSVCLFGGASCRRGTRLAGLMGRIIGVGRSCAIITNDAGGITTTEGRLIFALSIALGLSRKVCRGISGLTSDVSTPTSSVCVAKARPCRRGRPCPMLLKRWCGRYPIGGRGGHCMSVGRAGRQRASGCHTSLATNGPIFFGRVFMVSHASLTGQSGISIAVSCIAIGPKTTRAMALRHASAPASGCGLRATSMESRRAATPTFGTSNGRARSEAVTDCRRFIVGAMTYLRPIFPSVSTSDDAGLVVSSTGHLSPCFIPPITKRRARPPIVIYGSGRSCGPTPVAESHAAACFMDCLVVEGGAQNSRYGLLRGLVPAGPKQNGPTVLGLRPYRGHLQRISKKLGK